MNGFLLPCRSTTWADGGIIVYNFNTDSARRFDHSSLQGNPNGSVTINGQTFKLYLPSDGIALTPDTKMLYYSTISTFNLFSVPTSYLQNFSTTNEEIGVHVSFIGVKGLSDGMAFDHVRPKN
jgi:sugar lactone lactonase YvrE